MALINVMLILTAIAGVFFVYWLEFCATNQWSPHLRFHHPKKSPTAPPNPVSVSTDSNRSFGVWLPESSDVDGHKVNGAWVAVASNNQMLKSFRLTQAEAEATKQEFQHAYPSLTYVVREHADNCLGMGVMCCVPK